MMKSSRKNKLITGLVFTCLALLCPLAKAQQQNKFRYKADVTKIDSAGVYKIELQPRFTAKCTISDLSDIRLVDEKGKFVAYSIVSDSLGNTTSVFIKFPEIKQVPVDTTTIYVSKVAVRGGITNLWLRLKNTDVNRLANLSGSDDLKHWFAIKEGIELQSAGSDNSPEYEQMISFPKSTYSYLRIEIINKNRDPVKIIQSGIYISGDKTQQVKLVPLDAAKLSVTNGKQQTNYFAEFDDRYFVDGLKISIASPKYYNRLCFIFDTLNGSVKRVVPNWLSSSQDGFVHIFAKTDKIGIRIDNGDDNPLIIKEVIPMQMERSVVAYLEKGHKYSLLVGDSAAKEVSYDLTFLHSKPIAQFPVIQHSAVYKNPAFGVAVAPAPRNLTPFIWAAIAVVLVVLGSLTLRMVKEVDKKQGG